jgi:hypothetical protein
MKKTVMSLDRGADQLLTASAGDGFIHSLPQAAEPMKRGSAERIETNERSERMREQPGGV